jgi:hypothetical protein
LANVQIKIQQAFQSCKYIIKQIVLPEVNIRNLVHGLMADPVYIS